jgi:hypothetical protein
VIIGAMCWGPALNVAASTGQKTGGFRVIKATLDDLWGLTRWARDAVRPAQLTDGLITLHIIDQMVDIDPHGWTPVRDRGLEWHQCTPSSLPRPWNPT